MKRHLAALGILAAALLALPASAALKNGTAAPDFTAQAYLAGDPFTFRLADALAQGPVVLYFFPAAFTPGCNVEAALFSQAIDRYKAHGATVIGVTAGNTERLAEFSKDGEKCAGKFPVAADPGAAIARRYDAILPLKPDLSNRTSYVIGRDGRIRHVHSDLNPNQHVKATLEALDALPAAKPAPKKPVAKPAVKPVAALP